jgi:indole-3-glycerol phosphate synthase
MADVLSRILADKAQEVAAAKAARPQREVEAAARTARPARDFFRALALEGAGARVIAECKRKSPSRGVLCDPYDPVELARAYERGGAAAISVLTDGPYFGGALAHLTAVAQAVSLPVLRKDFVIDEYQVWEARAAGADTFLLIAGPLDAARLETLIQLGRSLGMEPLIESHDEAELTLALATSGRIHGINNRNLKTFGVDFESSRRLAARFAGRTPRPVLVCESGIKTAHDIELMQPLGYNAFLIGEALVTHSDPQAGLAALLAPAR